MKCGVFMYPQNYDDTARFLAVEAGDESQLATGVDTTLLEDELRFGDLVEPLGFDSIWTVEHHFSPYAMVPSPMQFLAYWAGRTERVGMGTMVVVAPWHHPARLAGEISMLQHMLGDRDLMVGFGRGLARREYGGFNIPQGESRGRFDENVEAIKAAFSGERFSYQGTYFQLPDVSQRPESPSLSIRPQARDAQRILENLHAAWGSPSSAPILGRLGLQPLIIPTSRTFHDYGNELNEYNRVRVENGYRTASPTVAAWTFCHEDDEYAAETARKFNAQYAVVGEANYEFNSDHLKHVPGYEYYAKLRQQWVDEAEKKGNGNQPGTIARPDPREEQPWGTPDQCIAKIERVTKELGVRQWLFDFKYGGMPYELAEKSIGLFAKEVLPYIHSLPEPEPPVVRTSPTAEAVATT